jgi:hypothetical protein
MQTEIQKAIEARAFELTHQSFNPADFDLVPTIFNKNDPAFIVRYYTYQLLCGAVVTEDTFLNEVINSHAHTRKVGAFDEAN